MVSRYRLLPTAEPPAERIPHYPAGIGVSDWPDRPCAECGETWPCPTETNRRAGFDPKQYAEATAQYEATFGKRGSTLAPNVYGPPPAKPDAERLDVALRGDGPCHDCGTLDNIVWFTDNVFWNAVTGENVAHEESRGAILCVVCFVRRTAEAGLHPTGWRLLPDWPWRATPLAAPTATAAGE